MLYYFPSKTMGTIERFLGLQGHDWTEAEQSPDPKLAPEYGAEHDPSDIGEDEAMFHLKSFYNRMLNRKSTYELVSTHGFHGCRPNIGST